MLERLAAQGFDVAARNHARAILDHEFAAEMAEVVAALAAFRIPSIELIASGGGEAPSTQRLRRALADAGWIKHNFHIVTTVDGRPLDAGTSHEIDHVRFAQAGTLALEIEWNNKDPFFDRDLENFQRLHARSVISAGIIITRGAALQSEMAAIVARCIADLGATTEDDLLPFGMKARTARQREAVARAMAAGAGFAQAFARSFVADKFGAATTHWAKLADRVARGVGNPCPLLLIGLPASVVVPYSAATEEL